jgi:hypothetical protein
VKHPGTLDAVYIEVWVISRRMRMSAAIEMFIPGLLPSYVICGASRTI